MAVLSRHLMLCVCTMFALSASAANSAPLDDCKNFTGKTAIAPCTLVIDDQTEIAGNRAFAFLLRARAEMNTADLEKADWDIAAGLVLRPNLVFGYRLRGRLREMQDRIAEARADYVKALQMSGTPALKYLTYLERGEFFTRIKQYPDALADLDAAIQADGAKAAPYVRRAIVYREMGNIDAALASLEQAAAIEPAYVLTYLERGDILVAQKLFKEAIAAFDLALAQDPKNPRAQRGRAAAVAAGGTAEPGKEGEPPTVVAAPQPAPATPSAPTPTPAPTAEGPPAPVAGQPAGVPDPAVAAAEERKKKLQSALELRNNRKFAEALAIYEAMLKATPSDLEVAIEKGRTLIQLTRWKDAIDAFKAVIDAKGAPNAIRAIAMASQSEVLTTTGQYDEAIKVASEAVRLDPLLVLAFAMRGLSQYQIGAFAPAAADFQQADKLAPKSPLFASLQALALICAGETAQAKEVIDRLLAADPDNGSALHARARLRLATGDIAAAEADFAQVKRRNPQVPFAVETQQLIMLHKVMKPTDAPLTPQPR
jgi:tetratricopeptide (TPR) repeat protein